MKTKFLKLIFATALSLAVTTPIQAKEVNLLNVSYDPTRELYKEYNPVFAKYWKAKTGDDVTVNQSHGGGGALRGQGHVCPDGPVRALKPRGAVSRNHAGRPTPAPFGGGASDFASDPAIPGYPSGYA